jgi:SAM-dependent methyltransferase
LRRPAGWQPDERASAGREHLDAGYVAGYDVKTAADWGRELELLRAHGLGRETTFVDIGAGTGLLAVAAARDCRRVVAVDPSPAMLAFARRRAEAADVENIDFVEGGFLTYEHEGPPPELVHSRNALHHLSDFWKGIALARLHDLVASDGIFVLRDLVFSFEPQEADERIEEWLGGAAASPERGWTRVELEEHLRLEASTYSWLLEELLRHAGFTVVEATHDRGVYSTYVCRCA